jgi:O-antigen/teichoic acid export membrane protein
MLTSLSLNAIIGLVIWCAAPYAVPLFIAPQYLAEAQALVPYIVASTVIGALAMAATSAIDGTQRVDQRAIVVSVSSVVFLFACLLLVPSWGMTGFGAATVLQQVAILALGWVVLRRHITRLGWLPCRWQRSAFVETTGYAVKLGAIGAMGLMVEPLAKFAFNQVGGPGLVALYELASRPVVQMRSLVLAAATPLIPAFAERGGADESDFRVLLTKATRVAALAAVGTALITLAAVPVVSQFVLGKFSAELLLLTVALTVGWSLNILAIPIYFAAQAVGIQRWNFIGHAVIDGFLLLGANFLLRDFGSLGILFAIIVGLIASTLTVLIGNAWALRATDLIWHLRWILLSAGAAIVISCLAPLVLVWS